MRVWLDPDKLASRNMTAGDVVKALKEQNIQVAAGADRPAAGADGAGPATHHDHARPADRCGAVRGHRHPSRIDSCGNGRGRHGCGRRQASRRRPGRSRGQVGRPDRDARRQADCRHRALPIAGSNALDVADRVKEKMKQLAKRFPAGLEYAIVYDTTPFIEESVAEVFKTLRDAIILVTIVILVFLQDWKAMILPLIDVAVSLIGTFAFMKVLRKRNCSHPRPTSADCAMLTTYLQPLRSRSAALLVRSRSFEHRAARHSRNDHWRSPLA